MASGNSAGFAALDDMIRKVRSFPGLAKEAAPEVGKAALALVQSEVAAGRSPQTGVEWVQKKDGGRPLKNAAAAISVATTGTSIVLVASGPEVFHHFGAQGKPRRNILPTGSMPFKLGNAIRFGFVQPFKKKMGAK